MAGECQVCMPSINILQSYDTTTIYSKGVDTIYAIMCTYKF